MYDTEKEFITHIHIHKAKLILIWLEIVQMDADEFDKVERLTQLLRDCGFINNKTWTNIFITKQKGVVEVSRGHNNEPIHIVTFSVSDPLSIDILIRTIPPGEVE